MSTKDFTDNSSATMSYKSSFSYKNDNINIIYVTNNVEIRIEKITSDVARVYFVSQGREIQVLANTILRNINNNQNEPIFRNSFYITWVPDYILFHDGVEVFQLENQKLQAIKGAIDLETDVIQQ
ncbi:2894_t:CDS:1 [Dentiscutata erythropus]|uniref:2894_t:CDS:1 n=1 Tax=Dentiscutata erythropus TaxID=1348616 RepID=A0A9N9GFX8_9GLOM|nr:2894_t:CDS:1 [Dentiscutata erythropus]